MAKARARRKRKATRILREPGSEFGIAGILQGGNVFCQEIHLLRQAALDDLVVLVEPKSHGFTEENLLAHPLLDQGAHLDQPSAAADLARAIAPPIGGDRPS